MMDDLEAFKKRIKEYIAEGYNVDGVAKWLLELDQRVRDLEDGLKACREEKEMKLLKRRKR